MGVLEYVGGPGGPGGPGVPGGLGGSRGQERLDGPGGKEF